MAGRGTVWSADVPVSMPVPTDLPIGISMSGFAFTTGGLAHDISKEAFARLSTPDFQPAAVPTETVYEDLDVDGPPATMETF